MSASLSPDERAPRAQRVLVIGGGKIGGAVAHLLRTTGAPHYDVEVIDATPTPHTTRTGDVTDPATLDAALADADIVVSAAPFHLTTTIASAAHRHGVHYFDLTEDVASARATASLAADETTPTTSVLMPQCGLAPGFVSVVAADLARNFDADGLRTLSLRVGALPQFPTNALKYNLTWSTDGLINEYCNPCNAIVDGEPQQTTALEDLETFSLDGVAYEAFNTSGGLGSLCDTFQGRIEDLDYKTVRYPGHRDLIKVLVRDLRLHRRRDLLKDVLEAAIPITYQDVVLVFVTASGTRDGRLTQESFARKVYAADVAGRRLSAIQLTTAAGVCAMVDLVRTEKLPTTGLVRQEQCSLDEFLANRFGALYLRSQEVRAA
jgi:saccharopine dehydrogenase-like NADP-dependent oxidoreductase